MTHDADAATRRSSVVLHGLLWLGSFGLLACSGAQPLEASPASPVLPRAVVVAAAEAPVVPLAAPSALSNAGPPAFAVPALPAPVATPGAAPPQRLSPSPAQTALVAAATAALHRHTPATKRDRDESKELYVRACVNGVLDDTFITLRACEHAFDEFAAGASKVPRLRGDEPPIDLSFESSNGVASHADLTLGGPPPPPPPDVRIGALQSSVPLAHAARFLADMRGPLRACLRELGATARGSLSLAVTIAPGGTVSDASATNLVGVTAAQAACIVRTVKYLELDLSGATSTVSMPVEFGPAARGTAR